MRLIFRARRPHNPLIVIQHKNSMGTNSSSSSSFQKRKSSTSITSLRFGNNTIGGGATNGNGNAKSTTSTTGGATSTSSGKPSPSNKPKTSGDAASGPSSAVQKVAKLVAKTPAPPMIDRIAKFRAFKQKSLAIEMMFARSSSGASSLEHQTSFDESSLINANRTSGKKSSMTASPGSVARMGANMVNAIGCGKKATVAFRVPNLFSLVNNNRLVLKSSRNNNYY